MPGAEALRSGMRRLCVFCGSADGARPEYVDSARALGTLLAQRGIELVYGGASVGLMGAVADATLSAGGHAVGVIPRALMEREIAHTGLTRLHVVDTMHQRKALMGELSDAFAALPGGLGTLEELFEVWTWTQLGIHAKPLGLLDVRGYFAPLVAMLDHAVREGFVRRRQRESLTVARTPDALLRELAARSAAVGGGGAPLSS